MAKENKKVVVAMSGGVDSSVAAALLKKQGYQVIGAFMHFWIEPLSDVRFQMSDVRENKCCSIEAEEKARAVAAKLDIPFYVFHFEKEFKKAVVDYFLKEYAAGRTPNPCVVCNQKIKFGLLLKKTLELDVNYLATGHYVKKSKVKSQKSKVIYKLLTAKDKEKDQSYFLYTLTQQQLKHLLFPIGNYRKSEVYSLAKKWQLPYRKQESFDICFIAGKNHNEFLKRYLKLKPGKIINIDGKIIGQHQGLSLYTIGQKAEIGGSGPYYVVELDQKNNTLIVTNTPNDPKLYKKSLIAEKVNWISGQKPELPLKCEVKIRYRHPNIKSVVTLNTTNFNTKSHKKVFLVEFKNPQRAITPGQSVVFYQKSEVLGGGVIF